MARVWGGGQGGQCKLGAIAGSEYCARHAKEAKAKDGIPSHGHINGPIPLEKQKAFAKWGATNAANAEASNERKNSQVQENLPAIMPCIQDCQDHEHQLASRTSPQEVGGHS